MINLLPLDEKKVVRRIYFFRLATVGLFGFSLVLTATICLLIPSFFLTRTKARLVEQERSILQSSQEYVAFDTLRDTVAIVNERLMIMDRASTQILSEVLVTRLLRLKTEDVTYTSINYSQGVSASDVELRGQARDRPALVGFIQQIGQDSLLEVVEAPVSNFIDANNLGYVLRLRLANPLVKNGDE